jgi:hypothetical protein
LDFAEFSALCGDYFDLAEHQHTPVIATPLGSSTTRSERIVQRFLILKRVPADDCAKLLNESMLFGLLRLAIQCCNIAVIWAACYKDDLCTFLAVADAPFQVAALMDLYVWIAASGGEKFLSQRKNITLAIMIIVSTLVEIVLMAATVGPRVLLCFRVVRLYWLFYTLDYVLNKLLDLRIFNVRIRVVEACAFMIEAIPQLLRMLVCHSNQVVNRVC